MAHSDKNIIITPNNGSSTDDPKIVFTSANAAVGPLNITLRAYPINGGMLSFEGNSGQLFSIVDSLTGTLFAVNDISGLPSLEVLDTGHIRAAQYSGNLTIGFATDNNTDRLQVNGTTVSSQFKSSATTGTAPFVINSTTMVSNLNSELLGGQNGAYYLAASNLTGTLSDARLSSNVPLKNAVNTFTAAQIISAGTSTANSDWLLLQPSDYATSKPRLFVNKSSTATQYDIGLFDGTNNNGTINFNVQNLTLRGTALMATNTAVTASQMPASTGDVTSPAGSTVMTLATVNSNVGTFGSTTLSPVITVNAKGLITAVSTTTIAPAWSSIASKPTTLGGFGITDAVNSATTYLGVVGNLAFDSTQYTTSGWSNLPVGYSKMMSGYNGGTTYGYPVTNAYGYFTKIANRDAAGGWSGLWLSHSGGSDYFGFAMDATVYPTWRKIWTSANQGAGSNLDADLLDGQQGAYYQNATNIDAGTLSDSRLSTNIPRVYRILSNGATANWVKLGTFTVPSQSGQTILIKIVSHAGYNAQIAQNAISYVFFKVSNGSSFDASGFPGDSYYYSIGRNVSTPSSVKWVADAAGAAARSFTLYGLFGSYNDNSFYTVDMSSGTWVDSGLISQPDPGVSSNTVCISTNEFLINGQTVWHAGNDGAASTLDADLLDGQQGSFYQNATNINAGTIANARLPTTLTGKTFSSATSITSGTITASSPALSITQTWNNSGVLFNALTVNVTDTSSSSSSTLLNLQTSGTNRFTVFKDGAITAGGTSIMSSLSIQGAYYMTGISSPATITADQNDYTVSTSCNHLRLATDADRTITGFSNGLSGRTIFVHNIGSYSIFFAHENTNSTAANRFHLSGSQPVEVKPYGAILVQYDVTASRWKIVGGAGSSGVALANTAYIDIPNNFSVTQNISVSNATTSAEYLRFTPSDVGAGKPYLFIGKNSNATQWDIGLSTTGSINFANTVTAPTVPVLTDASSNVATTAFVQGVIANSVSNGGFDSEPWDPNNYSGFAAVYATGTGSSQNVTIPVTGHISESIWVTVDNVLQVPTSYSVSGTTVTLTAPPSSQICIRSGGFKGDAGDSSYTLNTQTSGYTLVLTDKSKMVEINSATAVNLTVPPNSSVAFATGTRLAITQMGAGVVTVTPGAGVTIRSFSNYTKTKGQYSVVYLYKRGTDEWVLSGDIGP